MMAKVLMRFVQMHKTDMLLGGVIVALAVHALYCFSFSDSRIALAFAIVSAGLVCVVYSASQILRSKGKLKVETLFLLSIICCGLLYSLVFAPGTVPDESYHFQASYKMADQLLFLGPTSDNLPMRADDAQLLRAMDESQTVGYEKYDMMARNFVLFAGQVDYVSFTPRSVFDWGANPPYIKLPSALGIVLASLLNLGSYPLFYLGRFFNMMMFALLAYCAVRITPVGKNTMMVVGLLPMTLHVVSSYSYDAGIIGLAFLLTALCFRALYGEGQMKRHDKVGLVIVAALLAPCKVVYTVIALLVLFIPNKRFASRRSALLYKSIVIACSLVAVLGTRMATLLQMADVGSSVSAGLDVRGEEQGTFYSLSGMLSDPLDAVLLYLRTFDAMGPFYLDTLVGGSLGWFQPEIHAPLFITLPLFFALLVSAQRSEDDRALVPGVHRVVFAVLAIAGWLAVMLSMTVGWTFVSERVIQGVQGRYFLPLLPMALVAARSRHVSIDVPTGFLFVYGLLALNIAYMARVFSIAVGV
ncbi:DUF2142 domain-containing protein [Paraeggerthella sp. Marseille-Q4926]|uniref:DUF2142 domain-containing protein n=2 Tax=Paraeggerthella TaxID=651554 RepID=UPI001CE45198|nr:DUF2142 domain-containing protein [Paraeggerthella sp. Marseille-Q4926]